MGENRWGSHHSVLTLCTVSYFATRVEPIIVSPLVPDLLEVFEATKGDIGLALTGLWAAYALVQLPSGLLADRLGARRLVLLALGASTLGSVALAAAPSLSVFVAVAVLLGAGVGLYYNVGALLVASSFRRTARAIGIHRLGSQLAGLAAPPLAVLVALRYGWRTALLLGAVVSVPVLFAVALWLSPSERAGEGQSLPLTSTLHRVRQFLWRPTFLLPTAVAAIGEFVAVAHMSFLPVFLVETGDVSQTAAGLLFSLYFAMEALAQPTAGWLADLFSPTRVLGLTMAAGTTGIAVLLYGGSVPAIGLGVALSGLSMGYNAPVQSEILDTLAADARGTGFGTFRFVYVLIGSLGGVVTGTIVDGWGWTTAYGFLGGGFVVAILLLSGGALVRPRIE